MAPARRRILLLDGGLGTALAQDHGVVFGRATPLWSAHLLVADPHTLRRCHAAFARVPVDVLLTATYQASATAFAATRTDAFPAGVAAEAVPGLLATAVRVAVEAAAEAKAEAEAEAAEAAAPVPVPPPPTPRVALSLGPYGACTVPSAEYSARYDAAHDSRAALRAWHAARMRLFAAAAVTGAGVAYVALETVPRVDEVEAMRQALADVPALAALPFWLSCVFPDDGGEALPDGASPEAAVRAMLHPAVAPAVPWAIGINCTRVARLDALLRRYEAAVEAMLRERLVQHWPALVLYPDGTADGEVYNTATQAWERRPEGGDAAAAADDDDGSARGPWEQQLARVVWATEARAGWSQIVVGGCCKTGVDDIARLRRLLLPESRRQQEE